MIVISTTPLSSGKVRIYGRTAHGGELVDVPGPAPSPGDDIELCNAVRRGGILLAASWRVRKNRKRNRRRRAK